MKFCKKSKYRIAYIMHRGEVSTYGGFPQHVEHSIYGLKKLGHDVDFYFISNVASSNEAYVAKKIEKYKQGDLWTEGQHITELDKGIGTGYYFHNGSGWLCAITPTKNYEDKVKFRDKLETYDAVFWHTPFWFKQKSYQKDKHWPMLLDLKNPVNIAFHHDGNIRSNSAWMINIDKYFDRIITVHPASYNSCKVFSSPRCMIFNPQILDKVRWDDSNFHTIKNGNPLFFSLQYWKGSKHVDDLIRAIPHFYQYFKNAYFVLGGRGMEYSYMNSKDKIKPQYITSGKYDPDLIKKYDGVPIIKAARVAGEGKVYEPLWLNAKQRDELFEISSFFVDTAYYSISEELGEHFSRTLIESIMHGVVPIARNLALSDNLEGVGSIFKPWENYLMIRHDATPREFANKLLEYLCIDESQYNKIVENNYRLLKHFDIDYVCGEYIKVIRGEPAGWYNKYEVGGEISDKVMAKANKQWFGDGEKRCFNFVKGEDEYA